VPAYSNRLWPRIQITWFAWQQRGQINHITGDIHFIAMGLPRRRTILTIHDCGFMRQKPPIQRFIVWLFWLKWPVSHCAVVTAVSEATKQDIIRYTGCTPDKVRVIPTVIKTHFHASPKPFSAKKPRILHIGTGPNKNLIRHIEALADIPCTLHIIGSLQESILDMLRQYKIDYLNQYALSDAEMQRAYEACDLLLFASTLEGFGMPILEAQTVGRPVVTGNCSSMPEVAGSGACLVDPFSTTAIREGVLRVIRHSDYREALIAAGFENLHRFQAEAVARQYAALYREVSDYN
jgi:glycosyltransferase involved in cell wall biosynthesis